MPRRRTAATSGHRTSRAPVMIRKARSSDAPRIAALCSQLGYPSSSTDILRRLDRLDRDPEHALYVAKGPGGTVLGYIDAAIANWIVADAFVEVGALVIDERQRGAGIGKLLLYRAERWARVRKLKVIRLRSNIMRKQAHAFYRKLGYEITKTQYAFQKVL